LQFQDQIPPFGKAVDVLQDAESAKYHQKLIKYQPKPAE
jgi:hypothetical protein